MENGTYSAVAVQIVIAETKESKLPMAVINHCIVGEGDVPTNITLKSYSTLISKDGAVNTRTVDNLKEIFGWDGNDPFWLAETDLSTIVHDIVVENEDFTTESGKTIQTPKIKWVNVRGKSGMGMPEPADKRSILAKYGSKFRAVSGGVKPAAAPVAPVASKAPPVPPPSQKPLPGMPPEPAPDVAEATQEEAWEKLVEAKPGAEQAALEVIWYDAIKGTHKKAHELNGKDWGRLISKFLDAIPY